jgi:hypothetical protein
MHRKYNTTQKNMRQIPIYSLREALHIEINFTPCCSIKHCTKFHKVKHWSIFLEIFVHVHKLNFCMHVHVMVISLYKNFHD